jgi:xanthine dehydrogenase YagR molybdenum-binding subunit
MSSEKTGATMLPSIGRSLTRIDGPLKVSGVARYSSDFHFPRMLHAVPVGARIASGRINSIDSTLAAAMPGVQKIYTRENIGDFQRLPKSSKAMIDERRPPLADDQIHYYGQYVALVVADSFEQATAAADKITVNYSHQKTPDVSMKLSADEKPEIDTERGDTEKAFKSAAVTVDHTYTTPTETHNPIELHASVALWDGENFTLYETSQAIMNHRAVMATMLGVPLENIRVITEYLGSGFGGKLWPWTHALLAAAAARDMGVPIKLVVNRQMMFHNVGHRTNTQQRMRLGASRNGKLVSLQQDFIQHRSRLDISKEDCGEVTGFLYSTPNLRVTSASARRDIAPNTSMRGPGAVPGLYAVESAMDELAIALNMDPVELRLRNEPDIDESKNIPFSSRHLKECLTTGAERFGWSSRTAAVGSMHKDGLVLGWGMAACSWQAASVDATARVTLNADGSVSVASGTQDIGTGTYTVLAQMVSQLIGVDVSKVDVVIGNTDLPAGPMSGGSMATASLVPAVGEASREAIANLLKHASGSNSEFAETSIAELAFTHGRVHRKDQSPNQGRRFEDVLASAKVDHVDGSGNAKGTFGKKKQKYSSHSYGAHFVEVTWEPAIARLRISRTVTVIDAGKIINPLTGRNQIEGAIIMGIGMAMFEETQYDRRNGMAINSNLADYVMATHADSPDMDVVFLDYPDTRLNEMGARGIGEIGIAGFAAAVTAAVYHATGVRVRDLPVHIEDLLVSEVA